jgi:hypothetical protein
MVDLGLKILEASIGERLNATMLEKQTAAAMVRVNWESTRAISPRRTR